MDIGTQVSGTLIAAGSCAGIGAALGVMGSGVAAPGAVFGATLVVIPYSAYKFASIPRHMASNDFAINHPGLIKLSYLIEVAACIAGFVGSFFAANTLISLAGFTALSVVTVATSCIGVILVAGTIAMIGLLIIVSDSTLAAIREYERNPMYRHLASTPSCATVQPLPYSFERS